MKMYEIRFGKPYGFKSITTNDFEQALRMYDKIKEFAKNHNLTWTIALWYRGYLEKSECTNGEELTFKELMARDR